MKFPYYYKEEIELPYGGYTGVIIYIDEKGYEHSQYTEDISQMYAMEMILDDLGYQENIEKYKYTRKEN